MGCRIEGITADRQVRRNIAKFWRWQDASTPMLESTKSERFVQGLTDFSVSIRFADQASHPTDPSQWQPAESYHVQGQMRLACLQCGQVPGREPS